MLYEVNEVTKVFKGRKVLDLAHLEIEPEKIYTLIGPNGAGKTTLLNLLAFLDKPTAGVLKFCNRPVRFGAQYLLELRRRVVLVDQYPILFTGPVWKNVEFGLKVRGVSKSARRQRISKVLELVGMQAFAREDAHKLSGGETKRVALARALAVEPEVLLCDEPTANVDVENQEIILGILERINRENKTSILLSTHYLSQSRRLAHHTLMLEHGALSDKVNENIYRCQVIGREGDTLVCQLPGQVSLRLPQGLFSGSPNQFKIFIDPLKVQYLPDQGVAPAGNMMAGHVVQIEQEKGRVRISVCGDLGLKLNVLLSMKEYLQRPPVIGQKITLGLPDASIRCAQLGFYD